MAHIPAIKQAVILAGGLGTRLRPLTDNLPKPMAPVLGRPFLVYLVELLKTNGIQEIVILLGYKPEKVMDYFGDGSRFGVAIKYSVTPVEAETSTRMRQAADLLAEHFIMLYCDNYWPLNLAELLNFHNAKNKSATVAVYDNHDRITKNNIHIDAHGAVKKYDASRQDPKLNGVEIGFFILPKNVLEILPPGNFPFEKSVLAALIARQDLAGYLTNQRYYSISTIDKLRTAEKFLEKVR